MSRIILYNPRLILKWDIQHNPCSVSGPRAARHENGQTGHQKDMSRIILYTPNLILIWDIQNNPF